MMTQTTTYRTIKGISFTLTRRDYGRRRFYWASYTEIGGEEISLGDPWPKQPSDAEPYAEARRPA